MTPSNLPHALTSPIRHRFVGRAVDGCRRPKEGDRHLSAARGGLAATTELQALRVLLVEDMALMRGALVALLAGASGIEVAGQLECTHHVLSAAMRLRPDVVVVDVDLPGDQGLTIVRELHEQAPECSVLVLATSARPGLVRRALDSQVLGAVGKDASPERFAESIRRVCQGERVVDPNLAVAAMCVIPNPMTARELEALRLAAQGASTYEIAEELSLSGGTVRNYLSRAVSKTGARSRIDAIRIAREAAWL